MKHLNAAEIERLVYERNLYEQSFQGCHKQHVICIKQRDACRREVEQLHKRISELEQEKQQWKR